MTVQPQQRARKPRKQALSLRASILARVGHWSRRRGVLAGVVAVAATGIAVNALVLQSARHPAPLFAAVEQARNDAARKAAQAARAPVAQPLPPTRPAAEPATASTPPQPAPQPTEPQSLARMMADAAEKPARPVPDKAAKVAAAPVQADKPAQPDKAAQPEKAAQPDKSRPAAQAKGDMLGELIRGGIVPPGGIPSEPDSKILQAQRALARLGANGVKPDGFMGPATRAAIEKFERDKKWPVTGELSPRVLRELGTVSAARP